jgi:hypothetical protein
MIDIITKMHHSYCLGDEKLLEEMKPRRLPERLAQGLAEVVR